MITAILGTPTVASAQDALQASVQQAEIYSVARGGRLYDKWFAENQKDRPAKANPGYPAKGQYSGKKAADWRCKECHGWDYLGAKGAYSKGTHYTGFPGIERAYKKILPGEMSQILSNKAHGYTSAMLSEQDVHDLTAFSNLGTFNMDSYIDRRTKVARGDARSGKQYYQTICAVCHDLDGKGEDTPPLGALAWDNPWEVLHKILNGQPDKEMPALRAFGIQPSADVLSYMQSELPKE